MIEYFSVLQHAIAVGYDPSEDSWTFIDINQPTVTTETDIDMLVEYLFLAFDSWTKTRIIFTDTVYVAGEDYVSANTFFEAIRSKPESKKVRESLAAMTAKEKNTALFWSIEERLISETLSLLQSGADPQAKAPDTDMPLLWHSYILNNFEGAKALLAGGAKSDISLYNEEEEIFLFHEILRNQQYDWIELFLQNGTDPNLPDSDGRRPLHVAAETGNLPIVRLLLQYGAKKDLPCEEGIRPIDLARIKGSFSIILLLGTLSLWDDGKQFCTKIYRNILSNLIIKK